MKKFIIILFISSLFFSSCREKCKDGDELTTGYSSQMESYFGMYKPGNWWVYKNQDSTKIDSVFITDYSERIERDKKACIAWPIREFKLHSQFLVVGMPILNGIYWGHRANTIAFGEISANFDIDNDTYPQIGNSTIPEVFYDSIFVNLIKYNNVVLYQMPISGGADTIKYFLARNVGMIKFSNSSDTFSLKTYHIQ